MASSNSYYEQANPDLLHRIPVTAEAVLEIGCGAGALGESFKRINPGTIYIGVELMPEPAAKARVVLDHVIECDISNTRTLTLPNQLTQVDCLVFGDVLEHLYDPLSVIRQLLPFLKDEGKLIACIPNVQHWSSIANLLSGQWPQNEQGLFDRTHLRWFTKSSILSMINDAGLKTEKISPRIFNSDKALDFIKHLEPGLKNLNLNPQKVFEGVAPLQYVVEATKSPRQKFRIDGLMLKPQAGMNDVRMIQPLRSVATLSNIDLNLSSESISLVNATSTIPRIMIWQRALLTYSESLERIRRAIRAGYVLVSEFDDDPDHWEAIRINKNLNFTGVHAVQVSTPSLQEKIHIINPETAIFKNCLETLPRIESNKWTGVGKSKPFRLFYGALNRKNSWAQWIDGINKVISRSPELWEVEVVHDKEFYDAINTQRKRFTPTCNYASYIERLRHCHIAFLPLEENSFNIHKSDLKFVEAAACQAVAIASPTVYSDSLQENITGFLCKNGKDLIDILSHCLSNPSKAKTIAIRARNWCQENRMQYQQSEQRLHWYKSLWSRREELTKELIQRVPELN